MAGGIAVDELPVAPASGNKPARGESAADLGLGPLVGLAG